MTRSIIVILLVACLIFLGVTQGIAAADGGLTSPIAPPLGFTVNSWFDHDSPGQTSSSYLPFRRQDGYRDDTIDALCTGPDSCYCDVGVNCYNGHTGIDISTNDGANGGYGYPIVAAAAGYVQQVGYTVRFMNLSAGPSRGRRRSRTRSTLMVATSAGSTSSSGAPTRPSTATASTERPAARPMGSGEELLPAATAPCPAPARHPRRCRCRR